MPQKTATFFSQMLRSTPERYPEVQNRWPLK
jgi:hypothetical protein